MEQKGIKDTTNNKVEIVRLSTVNGRIPALICLVWLSLALLACGDQTVQPTASSGTTTAAATTQTATTAAATTSAVTTVAATTSAPTTSAVTTIAATNQAATTAPPTGAATTGAATTGAATTAAQATTAGAGVATTAAVADAPAPAGQVPPGFFQNPVLKSNFPDPHILLDNGTFYAYATNASGRNIQVASSTDLVNWELLPEAMPALPPWGKLVSGLIWAPEVIKIGPKYVLYYTGRDKTSNKQCVGVATSDAPQGKFKDSMTQPLVCQVEEGGTIDANIFSDGGKLYLYFKNDGNCCGQSTYLYVQELAPDGLSFVGDKPTRLIENDQQWEGRVVEAPTMFKHQGNYYLFFSGNDYAGLPYAVGYATCKSPLGPCQKAPENPILKTSLKNPPVIGPGHQTILQVGDQTWIIYHAWEVSNGLKTDRRLMWLDRIEWKDGKPVVIGPTTEPQPIPKVKP
ncbi:MAG: glycosidase [Chloroflexi bacterium]|jgi:GH43 family beta-xylosidase|nr:glycosidase [Chloroflexota bacterium]